MKKSLAFDYALVPHQGTWQEAQVHRAGLAFNNPLIMRKATRHEGALPTRWGLLDVSPGNVVISAVKRGRDGRVVVRVYEATGRPTAGAELAMHVPVAEAWAANLLEDTLHPLPVVQDALRFDLGAFEIATFVLRLGESGPM